MKARRKSDGEIISVEAIIYNAKSGERYSPSELDFNVDAEEISSLEEEIHTYAKMCSFTEADYTAIRKAVEHGVSLAKSDNADLVIQGWVCRDEDGRLCLYQNEPEREMYDFNPKGYWTDRTNQYIDFPPTLFPDLTWDDDPQEVELVVKRKKNG